MDIRWNYTNVSASVEFETGCYIFIFIGYSSYGYTFQSNILGICAMGWELKLCQLADANSLFLRNKDEIPKAVHRLISFLMSGLMNVIKSICFPLKKSNILYVTVLHTRG